MDITIRLAQLASLAMSGLIAPKIARAGWKLVTHREPPSQEQGSRLASLLVFAAISAVTVTAIQYATDQVTTKMIADRKAKDKG